MKTPEQILKNRIKRREIEKAYRQRHHAKNRSPKVTQGHPNQGVIESLPEPFRSVNFSADLYQDNYGRQQKQYNNNCITLSNERLAFIANISENEFVVLKILLEDIRKVTK